MQQYKELSSLKNLRKKFDRFCFMNRSKGIPNLMLYISLGSALVYILSVADNSQLIYNLLCFDRAAILQGQVWRLITYPLTYNAGNPLFTLITLVCYYSLGRAIENIWGVFRFNLFYFSGILMMDLFCLLIGGEASAYYLNLSLFLSYATLYPNTQFLLLFVIPVKAWIFALMDLAFTLYDVLVYTALGFFPFSLFPLVALLNYFLFFGKDVLNVIPLTWRLNIRRLFKKTTSGKKAGTIPFPYAGSYEASVAKPKAPYTHKCAICGKTDTSNPELEFRYCSRCSGYHCYCSEHISNHDHVQ